MCNLRRVLVALGGLITLALVAPWGAPKAVADGDRLGCSTYCQTAGGYGAAVGPQPPPAVTLVPTGTHIADADGYVPVTLTCHLSTQCRGVLILSTIGEGAGAGGRSTLLVNAGATRTIDIPLGANGIALLRSHGPTTFDLTIDASQEPTGEAPCGEYHAGCSRTSDDGFLLTSLDNMLTVAPPR